MNMKKSIEIRKIQNVTSRGQITLPVAWRRRFNINQVAVTLSGDRVEISPIHAKCNSEYTVKTIGHLHYHFIIKFNAINNY